MKKILLLLLCGMVWSSVPAQARSTSILRGGFGFLFPDNNSFVNPGSFALSHGVAANVDYMRQSSTEHQTAAPSIVLGSGSLGFGVYMQRQGTSILPKEGTDSAGVGFGFAIKDRLTVGLGFARSLEAARTNDGVGQVTLVWNAMKGSGLSLGVGAGTTLGQAGGNVATANVGVGYSFMHNMNFEGGITFNNLSSTGDYTLNVDATFGGRVLYLGVGYNYLKLTSSSVVAGRLGLILANAFDVSVSAGSSLSSGALVTYGANARWVF